MPNEFDEEFELLQQRSLKSNNDLIKEYWMTQLPCIYYGENNMPYHARLFSFKTKYIISKISII